MFRKLFTPISIGNVTLTNRIVMPAMSLMLADVAGQVTQRLIDYYLERARGGVGLIITEATCIKSPIGKFSHPIQLTIDSDKYIQGLRELTDKIHETETKIFCQLHHAGAATRLGSTDYIQPVSASPLEIKGEKIKARELTVKEIKTLVKEFAQAAYRAKLAGFDGIELHGAHGYLIQQFLSPHTNKRTDEYGGDLEGRMRFLIEIIRSSRRLVGSSFPIGVRLSGDEFLDDGLTISDTKEISQKLEEVGADFLHISAGGFDSPPRADLTSRGPQGCYVHLAEKVKEVVDIPVITVGRIKDPLFADKILVEGRADLVAMGRALLADPELPKKAAKGEFDDIRKCVACNLGCVMRYTLFFSGCTVNPCVGKEREYKINPAIKPKKVLVVGGGPAGLEAALVSAQKGHQVFLFEKTEKLGGQLNLAIIPPHKKDLEDELQYLVRQVNKKPNITVKLNVYVNKKIIEKLNPDAIIDATGAIPLVPDMPGIKNKNVVTAWEVLAGSVNLSENVVIAGGGMVGCETAEFLAEKGFKVTVVEMQPMIAPEIPDMRPFILESFKRLGVKVLTGMEIIEVEENFVLLKEKRSGETAKIELGNLVLAMGSRPNKELFNELKEAEIDIPIYRVGDCVKPRFLLHAIHEGFRVALSI